MSKKEIEFADKPRFKVKDEVYCILHGKTYKATVKNISLSTGSTYNDIYHKWISSGNYAYDIILDGTTDKRKLIIESDLFNESEIAEKIASIREEEKRKLEHDIELMEKSIQNANEKIEGARKELKAYNKLLSA